MQIWEMTKAEFFDHLLPKGTNYQGFDGPDEMFRGRFDPGLASPLPHATGYAFQLFSEGLAAFDTGSGDVAGFFIDDFLAVNPAVLGRNIGAGLIVAAYQLRPWGPKHHREVTEGGFATLAKAHRLEVEVAKSRGAKVPAAVLKEYP